MEIWIAPEGRPRSRWSPGCSFLRDPPSWNDKFGGRRTISSSIRGSVRCVHFAHECSKSNDDFRLLASHRWRYYRAPAGLVPGLAVERSASVTRLCTNDRRRDRVGDPMGLRTIGTHQLRRGLRHPAVRFAHNSLRLLKQVPRTRRRSLLALRALSVFHIPRLPSLSGSGGPQPAGKTGLARSRLTQKRHLLI
jgi:hypothetical protein